MLRLSLLPGLLILLFSVAANAVIETYEFKDAALYDRYKALSEELRCPKCQNQNIAASNAPISQDLREQLHQQLQEGKTDAEIVDYMVQRYGEFVLYRPRWSAATAVLWLAPVILLAIGAWIVIGLVRGGRSDSDAAAELSAEEKARLAALLKEDKRD